MLAPVDTRQYLATSHHTAQQSKQSSKPAHQGQIDKVAWNYEEAREVNRVGELEGADCVHSEGEDHAPVLWVVFQGEPFVGMTPESKC